ENILNLAGLTLHKIPHKRATLGFTASRDTGAALVVRSVEAESFAGKAGLHTGDVILKWNNGELPRRPERWAMEQNPGSILRLSVRREEKELTLEFRLGEMTETFFQVEENSHAGEKARRIREGLLRGETQAAGSN